ncbi:MAG: hypothetical protein WC740_05060 [Verrucomicrobiia bacterium]
MKTYSFRHLLFAGSLSLVLAAGAQEPDKKPAKENPKAIIPAASEPCCNVEINVSFVTFDLKEVEEMARKSPSAAPTQEQILKAWSAGKGQLLATSKVITIPDQQSKTEGVVERIYPTEYEPPRVPNDKSVPTTKDDWVAQPTPGGFQTRNIGLSVNATPRISDDGKTVDITIIPEFSEFIGWNNVEAGETEGKKTSRMWVQQPDFYSRRTTTSIIVPMEGTVVSGGMPDSTGKRVTYVFVTAHTVQPAHKTSGRATK